MNSLAGGSPWFGLALVGIPWLTIVAVRALRSHRLNKWQRTVLSSCVPYYNSIPRASQAVFEQRVRAFIEDKEFHGRSMAITPDMQVMIAAAAVQITLGLEELVLQHFTHIIVYPDKYRSRLRPEEHIGEVNPGMKAIVISWKHFTEGYRDGTDARNVGLHEMAHALWFENRTEDGEFDFLDKVLLERWRMQAEEEIQRIRKGEGRLFRNYAGTNPEEFFAVAAEYFFEQPRIFRDQVPELYATMKELLQQDPAAGEK